MKQPIRQLRIIQYLIVNRKYVGSYRDFAIKITGNENNASNIRGTLKSLAEAGVVTLESSRSINQHSENKTVVTIREEWLKGENLERCDELS